MRSGFAIGPGPASSQFSRADAALIGFRDKTRPRVVGHSRGMNLWLKIASVSLLGAASWGPPASGLPDPPAQCLSAVAVAERNHGIPSGLLAAIAQVESGRRDPGSGLSRPWPWTLNVEGRGYFFESSSEAIRAVTDFQALGIRSIDVGCMQVNLMYHSSAFPSLDAAFDPASNADYAAKFLANLFSQTGDWSKAAAAYHSATPGLGAEYQQKVFAVWTKQGTQEPDPTPSVSQQLSAAWSATLVRPFDPKTHSPAIAAFAMTRTPRIISLPVGPAAAGRTLEAYRAAPILLATRFPRSGG